MPGPIATPFPIFFDTDGGPLNDGYIYIGEAGLNPEASPKTVYIDPDLVTPVAQPIRTINGYPARDGTPAKLYISGQTCSITARNKKSALVYTDLDVVLSDPTSQAITGTVHVKDYGAVGDGVANDLTAIQAALDAGKVVRFGDSSNTTYNILSAINIPTGRVLIGDGATISSAAISTLATITGASDDVLVSGLSFSTSHTSADAEAGILDVNATSDGLTVDRCSFSGASAGVNGIRIKTSDTGFANLGRATRAKIMSNEFTVGRMGLEIYDAGVATVTGILIGANTSFNMTGLALMPFSVGDRVYLQDFTGTNGLDTLLNNKVFTVSATQPTQITITNGDGTSVSTAGMVWTGGGVVRGVMSSDVDVTGNTFASSGSVANGYGVSLTGAITECRVRNNLFRDNPIYGIRLQGASSSLVTNNLFQSISGGYVIADGSINMNGNRISGNRSIGIAGDGVDIGPLLDSYLENNDFYSKGTNSIGGERNVIRGNRFKNRGAIGLTIDGGIDNLLDQNTIDNSESTSNSSVLRFDNSATGNFVKTTTFLSAAGGFIWDQINLADANIVESYRTSTSGRYNSHGALSGNDVQPITEAFSLKPETNTWHAYYYNDPGKATLVIKHLTAVATDSQVPTFIAIEFAGLNGTSTIGDVYYLTFCQDADYDASPTFTAINGSAVSPTLSYDGSGYPLWTLTLPTNNEALFTVNVTSQDATKWAIY